MDPKYKDLPGIAVGQPDCFETDDRPESDQQIGNEERFESEHIESVKLQAESARENFKGKSLNTANVDFSDRIDGSNRSGYASGPAVFELGSGDSETSEQRFARLQHELKVLADQVKAISPKKSTERVADEVSDADIETLQSQLKQLQVDSVLGGAGSTNLFDPAAIRAESVMDQVSLSAKPQGKVDPSTASVTYEILYNPSLSKTDELTKLGALEARLASIEALVGKTDADKLVALNNSPDKGLIDAVESLSKKVQLLDTSQLELVEMRLTSVLQKLNQIKDRKSTNIDADVAMKVGELYEGMKKFDSTCDHLPELVTRMRALRSLHEQAMQFSQAITQLDGVQQHISKTLESDSTLLQEVNNGLKENVDLMTKNFESLDKRIKALGK